MRLGLDVDTVRGLLNHPTRIAILAALDARPMSGTSEIAEATGVKPGSLRSHLMLLRDAGLVETEIHGGRHLHRLASPEIATSLGPLFLRPSTSLPQALHDARTCRDHVAGRLGVDITEALVARGHLTRGEADYAVTPRGRAFFTTLGIDIGVLEAGRRPMARACLDGSARTPHLAGALGAALLAHLLERAWIEREPGSRRIAVTQAGERALANLLGLAF